MLLSFFTCYNKNMTLEREFHSLEKKLDLQADWLKELKSYAAQASSVDAVGINTEKSARFVDKSQDTEVILLFCAFLLDRSQLLK